MSATLLPASTKICVFRNGDRNYFGKSFVIHRRQMADMDKLLDSITVNTGLHEAARYLCTPVGGTRIEKVEQLEQSKNYVAVTKGRFRKLPYLDLEAAHDEWLKSCSKRRQKNIKLIDHKNNTGSHTAHRVIKTTRGGIAFFVFCNGYMYEPPRRILLTEHMMALPWINIVSEISELLAAPFGAVKRLCTVDGKSVNHCRDLEPNGHYVAVGRFTPFKPLNYGTFRPPFAVTAHKQPKEPEPSLRLQSVSENAETTQTESSQHSKQQQDSTTEPRRRTVRRLPPVIYADGRTVFHAKPIAHKRKQSEQKPLNFDKDEGDIFKAPQRDETKDAKEIEDSDAINVDKPIDFTEAQQVEEEDLTIVTDHGTTSRGHPQPQQKFVDSVVYGDDMNEFGGGTLKSSQDNYIDKTSTYSYHSQLDEKPGRHDDLNVSREAPTGGGIGEHGTGEAHKDDEKFEGERRTGDEQLSVTGSSRIKAVDDGDKREDITLTS